MSISITPASELDLSLITFAGSDSTLTQQGGDKKKKEKKARGVCVEGGGEAIMEAINRGTAIFRGNTVLTNFKFPFFVLLSCVVCLPISDGETFSEYFFRCLISNMHSFERE